MHVILFVARQVRSIGQDHRKLFSIWSLMLTYLLNHVAANYVAILPSGRFFDSQFIFLRTTNSNSVQTFSQMLCNFFRFFNLLILLILKKTDFLIVI